MDARVELQVPDASAVRARVLVSPLLTLVTALMDTLGDAPPTPWRRLLRERARGLDSTPLAMFARAAFAIPDGLLPLPSSSTRTFEGELALLRASPLEPLRRDMAMTWPSGDVPRELSDFAIDPDAALARYCDALAVHWDLMLRPSWPQMRRLLEREVLLLGHTMATDGVAAMLSSVHPDVAYEDGRLLYRTGNVMRASYVARTPLTLAPLASESQRILVNEEHPEATVIAYSARGCAELWSPERRAPAAELAQLLGPTRARIALALALPASTSELAENLGLAPSTVSRHLAALVSTGLADRTRRGPLVYYRLTARGAALLDLF